MNKLDKTKSYKIQVLRGIAIIAVVCIHNIPNTENGQILCRPFVNFAVGLFLALSGFLSDMNNWKPAKRIKKVLPPYVLWTLVYVFLNCKSNLFDVPGQYLISLVNGKAAPMMYYIFVYIEFTLLIPCIDKLAKSRYRYFGFLITPLEIILMRLLPMFMGVQFSKLIMNIVNLSFLGWFSYFYLGYLAGNSYISTRVRWGKLIVALIVGICWQVVEGYIYFINGSDVCGTQLKLSAIFSGIIVVCLSFNYVITFSNTKLWERVLYRIGDNSFGIYFSHIAVMTILGVIPGYLKIVYPFNVVIIVLVTYMCVCIGKKILGKYSWLLAL